jgi:hypothetical protein
LAYLSIPDQRYSLIDYPSVVRFGHRRKPMAEPDALGSEKVFNVELLTTEEDLLVRPRGVRNT